MARPRKLRRVCDLPERNVFAPLKGENGDNQIIFMTVEEYETIRLIDLEGLNQEECANRMNIARTTAQRIYYDARKKLAEFLVNGGMLKIHGGDYKLCKDFDSPHRCGRCRKHGFGKQIFNYTEEE